MSTPCRNSYTVRFKVSVVEWQRKNEASIHTTAKHFLINRKCVSEWCQMYSRLKGQTCGALGKRRRLCWGKPLSVELDQKVFEFLEEERSEGRPVSNQLLKTKFKLLVAWKSQVSEHAVVGWASGSNGTMLESEQVRTMPRKFLQIMKISFFFYNNLCAWTCIHKGHMNSQRLISNMYPANY